MTRPHIIRADTIDLQDHDAPSAKDHSRHPQANTSLAPHQAETLREVAQDTADENSRSPRLSWATTAVDDAADPQKHTDDISASVAERLNGDASRAGGNKTMHKEDNLAIAQNGGHSMREDDSDTGGDTDESMDDDMMDKISSSPSIEDEDIDFEFVYALHTFVATVEGQANATKGDTMVLLDDSNSYWWLVRVVKDSSIGYLPAEHIETPTERLARLNKHRNIDLSASMLQDQTADPKSKSTFRLRGKKKKNVVFAEPTYVDYSDFDDYSSEEEDVGELFGQNGAQAKADKQQDQKASTDQAQKASTDDAMVDETAKVEPLKPRAQKEITLVTEPAGETAEEAEVRRSSEQFFEQRLEAPSRSRNGTVRNTDSFFKDETVETKKITLTPNLLRDDNQPRQSNESAKDIKRPSLDKMDKMERELQPDKKDDKKKKDKKPSAIRSFFSRKDKKKATEDDDDSLGKRSLDASNDGEEDDLDKSAPQRQPSKLQKAQPRSEPSPTRKPGSAPQKSSTRELAEYIASEGRTNDVSNVPPSSMRIVQEKEALESSRGRSPELARSASQQKEERSGLAKIKLSRSGSDKSVKSDKPQKVTKAKSRIELDDFDSSDEDGTTIAESAKQAPAPAQAAQDKSLEPKPLRPQPPGAYPDSYMTTSSNQSDKTVTAADAQQTRAPADRLSESPVQVSPVTSTNPPALVGDTSSQDDNSESPSPELVEAVDAQRHRAQDSSMTGSTSTGASQASSTWNDAKLRAFFDSSDDIRDMLVVVYDKTDVVPAGPDHPVVGPLFREQNAKLAEITTQLDNMLGDWLARKQRLRGAV